MLQKESPGSMAELGRTIKYIELFRGPTMNLGGQFYDVVVRKTIGATKGMKKRSKYDDFSL